MNDLHLLANQETARAAYLKLLIPRNERARLRALRNHGILDTDPEECFDQVVRRTAESFDVPIASFTLIDEHRQWFKSQVGLDIRETSRAISFCAHVVGINQALVIENILKDVYFADSELVQNSPFFRFYAGTPVRDEQDMTLGTLCIMDTKPRKLPWPEFQRLEKLAEQIELALTDRRPPGKTN